MALQKSIKNTVLENNLFIVLIKMNFEYCQYQHVITKKIDFE